MNSDKLNKWLTLIANFSVVAGIVFLGLEIQQNSAQLETQIAITRHQIKNDDIGRVVIDEGLAAAQLKSFRNEDLTDVERHRLKWMWATRFNSWALTHSFGQLPVQAQIAAFQETPLAKEFWDEYRPFMDPEFVAFIEDNVLDSN